MIDDQTFNRFALLLSEDIRGRAKGLDSESERLVHSRPMDHILSGFLTPRSEEVANAMADEQDIDGAIDLPRDSSFTMSSLGLECMVSAAELAKLDHISVSVESAIFLRTLPSLEEQKRHGIWSRQKIDGLLETQKAQSIVDVWQRFVLPRFSVRFLVRELLDKRKARVDVSESVRPLPEQLVVGIHTARRPVYLHEADVATSEAFATALLRASRGSHLSPWKVLVDARLIRVPTDPKLWRLAVRVVNDAETPKVSQADYVDPNVYGVKLCVRLPEGVHQPTIFQELPESFRYDRRMPGVGINSQVESATFEGFVELSAESVPIAETPRLEAREFSDVDPSFATMSQQPLPSLKALLGHMETYRDKDWTEKIGSLVGTEEGDAIKAAEDFNKEIVRFKRGFELLSDPKYPDILTAFLLLNNAMGRANKTHTKWRLFQLGFIVSQLPELASREYGGLASKDDGLVELLYFAAGGGKTEAFLGLMLWQAFFDRLRGKTFGNTAFVRFPLRLLTFQQLQRLAQALAAADQVRKDAKLKGARFSIGYLVGGTVTPNKISPDLHQKLQRDGVDSKFQRIFSCPYCSSSEIEMRYNSSLWLIEHRCTNRDCFSFGERLPVYVTDQDIYRFIPTIIVSTVDKLALLGQNHRFSNIFGRFDLVCGAHGASFRKSNEICEAAREFSRGGHPETCSGSPVFYGPFYDPSPALLVQDELHLLNEELGTFDSHYETGVIALQRSYRARPWKIVGATATIQDFRRQAWELYLSGSRQFPAHGTESESSFYYRASEDRTGRIFIGLLGVGRKHTPSVTKALAIFYQQVQRAREAVVDDPAGRGSRYELAHLSEEDKRDLFFLYELALTYVLTRKGSDQVAEAIESRVHSDLQHSSPRHGELLVEMFNGGVDVSKMIESIDALKTMTSESDPASRTRGIVTTNIIGHGVDVDRFNVILFAGFTRLVAEYIQASARVGRRFPGISIFVPTPQSERDRSIFDRFAKFHQYLDRLVDPAAVTRWPEPAMRRTLPGLLCGYLMGVASAEIGRPLATVEAVREAHGGQEAASLTQDAIVSWMQEAYGVRHAPSSATYNERLSIGVKNAFSSIVNAPKHHGRVNALNMQLEAMNSLRDVDEPAFIRVANSTEAKILRRLMDA
ncbi:helicase-related protein [Edaphobacter bradus]|uniref:helicase-related protein n=1 Tax=Edaphobacter bradus TaxID=2259016 RepID=UPI0021E0F686|nr:helicase-related protein [Edaphobacter bradus]